ncbi:MAG: Spy/CpxP family protein refolding chaperone [Phycisphaerae bacterium]|nr:Spy/CpxP family protein refolding chaperone [Phycisphaerae bacterium]
MNRRLLCTLLALAFTAPLLAQPAGRGGGGFRGNQGNADRGDRPQRGRMLDRLTEELDLSAEQQEQIRQIAQQHFQQMRENADASGQGGPGGPGGRFGGNAEGREALADAISAVLNEDQKARFTEIRERMRQNAPQRQQDPRQLIESLPDELELTDEQMEHYDIIADKMREQMEARRTQFEEMRPVFEEMREARQNGDDARVEELRAQLEAQRPQRGQLMQDFATDLEQILTPEQTEKLHGLMQQGGGERGQRSNIVTDARTMLQAFQRVGLTQDQQATAKQITQDTQKKLREINQKDSTSVEQLNKETKAQILALLTENQAERFEQLLQRSARPQRGDQQRPGVDRQRGQRGQRGQQQEVAPAEEEETP